MIKIMLKLWNSSPKLIINQIKIFLINILNIKKEGIIHKVIISDKKSFLIKMPFPMPAEYKEMINGSYEDEIKKIILNTKKENIKIWDIGAHIGYQTLVFCSLLKNKCEILSFEPNPNNVKWFKENIKINEEISSGVKLIEKAMSDKPGYIEFNMSDKSDATSSGGYMENTTPPLPEKVYKNFKKIEVETETIDNIIRKENLDIPDIIKIDVEGAEYKVILGGIETITRFKPNLIIEIHNIPMMYYIGNILDKLNYNIKIIDEKNNNIHTKIIYAESR